MLSRMLKKSLFLGSPYVSRNFRLNSFIQKFSVDWNHSRKITQLIGYNSAVYPDVLKSMHRELFMKKKGVRKPPRESDDKTQYDSFLMGRSIYLHPIFARPNFNEAWGCLRAAIFIFFVSWLLSFQVQGALDHRRTRRAVYRRRNRGAADRWWPQARALDPRGRWWSFLPMREKSKTISEALILEVLIQKIYDKGLSEVPYVQ